VTSEDSEPTRSSPVRSSAFSPRKGNATPLSSTSSSRFIGSLRRKQEDTEGDGNSRNSVKVENFGASVEVAAKPDPNSDTNSEIGKKNGGEQETKETEEGKEAGKEDPGNTGDAKNGTNEDQNFDLPKSRVSEIILPKKRGDRNKRTAVQFPAKFTANSDEIPDGDVDYAHRVKKKLHHHHQRKTLNLEISLLDFLAQVDDENSDWEFTVAMNGDDGGKEAAEEKRANVRILPSLKISF
jgi:hypothetical protein